MNPAVAEGVSEAGMMVASAGGVFNSSAHLKLSETIDSVAFWVEIGEFSVFW